MRYWELILKFKYSLTPFWSIGEQNGQKVPRGRFSKIYYVEENQYLGITPL